MNQKTKKQIEQALLKKAIGFDAQETVEEFSESEGEMKLLKRNVTLKSVPPDVSAVKLLLDIRGDEVDLLSLSDEDLEKEKVRLMKILKEKKKNED